jgi:methylated-DNA-protein-cysteine methyltransferase related protein
VSEFADRVREAVGRVPEGDVVTYGEVAAMAGKPGAARGAGAVLAASDGSLPWWRVVYASGKLAPGKEIEQARRLRREGVDVDPERGVRVLRRGSGSPRRSTSRS